MTDHIILTVPAKVSWNLLEAEFARCEQWSESKLFRVAYLPRSGNVVGAKCYVVHQGQVRGWIAITALIANKRFRCTTTGEVYDGTFIECSGPFSYQKEPIYMKGFQGWRYYNPRALTAVA